MLLKDECYLIVGLCMKVHRTLGNGFREAVYKDALEVELKAANIPYQREKRFKVGYGEETLPHTFTADFLIYKSVILEIKAASFVNPDAFNQTLNYLKASGIHLGLLVNFGTRKLQFQRIVCTR